MEMNAPEQSSALRQKWVNLNSASQDGFGIPIQVIPLSKLTPSKRKSLVLQLRSELEQIRLIQKKVEAHRANAASMTTSGGNIHSYVNTRKDPPGGIINKSFALNSGPGKKSGASGQKARGWNSGVTGRFKSANKTPVTNQTTATLFRQCDNLLKKLMTHQFSWVFNKPVDVVELKIPDYLDVIKHPMDFGTIKRKIDSDSYISPLEFAADVRLTFSNAMTYNPPGNDVYIMADTMSKFFETRWKPIQKKIDATSYSDSTVQRSVLHDEIEIIDPMAPCKKRKPSTPFEEVDQRKASPEQSEVVTDQIKRKMTDEEKRILSKDLESSVEDLPENIIDFLKKQCSKGGEVGEEEIEIDIDALGDDALFTLRRLLDELFQGKLANTAKAETCEMELPNESGLSNSSMQLGKESLYAVEGIDIGEDAPAGSSHPTVEIEKDSTLISNRFCNAESMDDTDSSSSSDSESECPKDDTPTVPSKDGFVDDDGSKGNYNEKANGETVVNENKLVSGEGQLDKNCHSKSNSDNCESQKGSGDGSPTERQVSYRAAILKDRFADIILKSQEKPHSQGDKVDPEKLRREKEELEMMKRKEKARLRAEAKAAEDARKRVEAEAAAEAAAEAKRVRELEREAARQALLKMEKTVEINENSRFLEDLEMLSGALPLEHLPSSIEEDTSPDDSQDGLGSFKFGGSNPLEQLGLYMKVDDEEEEPDATTNGLDDDEEEPDATNGPDVVKDVEEGEID